MTSLGLRNARTVAFLSECQRLGRTALASSAIAHWTRGIAEETVAIARQSQLADATGWGGQATRASWLYRWLTAEPEPDVVVIDLRETAIVGPILGLFDHALAPLVRNWAQARFRTAVTALSERVIARPVRTVSVVVLAAILATLLLSAALGALSSNALGAGLLVTALALAGTRVGVTTDELTETATYELLVALLSPPEPPDRD